MEQIFALYDSDSFYAARFMEYFKRRNEYNFVFHAFTRKDCLEEFLVSCPIEILLLGNQEFSEEISFCNVTRVYKLSEDPREESSPEITAVYKYQPAQSLMNSIMKDYYKKSNLSQQGHLAGNVMVISLFSTLPNAEAVTFTWSLGLMLAEQRKVFLSALELLPVPLITISDENHPALSEYIYYLKENVDSTMKIKSLLDYSGNLSSLTGISHASDILSLTKEDARNWVDEIKSKMDYQIVLFYLGTYTEATNEIMNLSDHVFVMNTGSAYEKAILSEWSRQMDYSGTDTKQQKFVDLPLTREENLGRIPLSLSDLKNTTSWNYAGQIAEYLLITYRRNGDLYGQAEGNTEEEHYR